MQDTQIPSFASASSYMNMVHNTQTHAFVHTPHTHTHTYTKIKGKRKGSWKGNRFRRDAKESQIHGEWKVCGNTVGYETCRAGVQR